MLRPVTEMVWAALVDRHRRDVLDVLRRGDSSVGELVEQVGLSQPRTSKHLRVLREAGLVTVRKRAQQRIYTIELGPMADIDAWLAPYRELWNDRLDALGRHLDASDRRPTTTTEEQT